MGIIDHILIQEAKIVSTTTDKHGDQIKGSEKTVNCRFRYITELDRNVYREGTETSDAIVWFASDANISEGTIIYADGGYWRINRLIKARRMSGNTVEFLKAFVKKHELVE